MVMMKLRVKSARPVPAAAVGKKRKVHTLRQAWTKFRVLTSPPHLQPYAPHPEPVFCRNTRLFFWTKRSLIFLIWPISLLSNWKMPPDSEKSMRIPSVTCVEETSNNV